MPTAQTPTAPQSELKPGLTTGYYYNNLSLQQQSTFVVSIIYIVILFICSIVISTSGVEWAMTIAYSVLSAILGWVIGMALSPYNAAESDRFAGIGRTISAFFTGYLLSKLDKILEAIINNLEKSIKGGNYIHIPGTSVSFRLVSSISMFILVAIVTYAFRYYDNVKIDLANKKKDDKGDGSDGSDGNSTENVNGDKTKKETQKTGSVPPTQVKGTDGNDIENPLIE